MGKDLNAPYETFEHSADIGIRGIGKDISQAFENGAKAMFSLMISNFYALIPTKKVDISCVSFDIETLFTAWLNTLLAEADMNGLIFQNFNADIKDLTIKGAAWGEAFDPLRHERGIEVKGATFTELKVYRRTDGLWVAQCVVDV